MSKVVGIDLGTTNSLVAYVKDGVPVVIRDKSGDALVPSVVSAAADGTVYVGREAQRRLLTDAEPHRVFGEAVHGQGRRRRRATRRGCSRSASPAKPAGVVRIGLGEREFTPPEDLGVHPARAEAPRRGVLRRSRARSIPRSIAR